MNPIRVLHVVSIMNRGGIETLLMNIYRNIDRSKVQFDFLVHNTEKGDYEDEIIALGGHIYRIPYVTKVGHFGYIKALNNFFNEHSGYRIVHSHMNAISGLILRSARRYGILVRISHCHANKSKYGLLEMFYKAWAKKYIKRNATDFFACSIETGKWLFGKAINKHINIIKNGVDLRVFKFDLKKRMEIRESLKISENTIIVGHVGRFHKSKNHSFLIDIFEEIHKQNKNTILLLVGDGSLKPVIEAKVNKLNLLNYVKFLGVRNDIHDLMNVFDVFVFPSLYEGLPVTLIEAQACGLKCYVSDTITREVDMDIDLIDFLSLKEPANKWAKRILMSLPARNNTHKAIKDKGYDINEITLWLEDFYINVYNKTNLVI